MRKHHITKLLYFFLTVFSLTANAGELDPTALEELREIVRNSFKSAVYHDGEELQQAENLKQYNGQNFSNACENLKSNSTFDILPFELLIKICIEIDDTKPFCQGMGLTCHRFYLISTHPVFSLNPYCLTETRPHNISRNILRTKVCNTKDGLFQLSALYSVSGNDLLEWFGKDLLESFLKKENVQQALAILKLGHKTVANTAEEALDRLYPIFKVALAVNQQKDEILGFIDRYVNINSATLNKIRLWSLHQDYPGDYYYVLLQLFYRLFNKTTSVTLINGIKEVLLHPDHQPAGVIARDLLLAGQCVINMNNCYYVRNPQKKEFSIQLMKWCVSNKVEIKPNPYLINDAIHLGCPELAFQAFQKIMPLTDSKLDQNTLSSIISSLALYINDKYAQPQIKEFVANIYCGNLSPDNKEQARVLMIRTGQQTE